MSILKYSKHVNNFPYHIISCCIKTSEINRFVARATYFACGWNFSWLFEPKNRSLGSFYGNKCFVPKKNNAAGTTRVVDNNANRFSSSCFFYSKGTLGQINRFRNRPDLLALYLEQLESVLKTIIEVAIKNENGKQRITSYCPKFHGKTCWRFRVKEPMAHEPINKV